MVYESYELHNGIKVVTERIPHFRSVSIGIWFRSGSVYETEKENGVSHFIEHMLFKGTEKRNARDIAMALDAVGGQLNAFTGKECTCFYSKVMDEHLDIALELLSDMVQNSIFLEEEILKEKGVIIEEISMYEDSPDDVAHELLSKSFFRSHPLGQPILGTTQNIRDFTKEAILDYYYRFYNPQDLVISVAGNFQQDRLKGLIENYFGSWDRPKNRAMDLTSAKPAKGVHYRFKDIEQAHLCIGFNGVPLGDDDIYPLMVLNNVLGGGMSSRLFQRIREDRGLAYSVFSYPSSYVHGGMLTIYSGMKPGQVLEVASLIAEEIKTLQKGEISQDEFYMAKEQLKGNYILGLESTGSRMTAIGKNQLLMGRVLRPDTVLSKIDNIQPEDVFNIGNRIFTDESITVALVSKEDMSRKVGNLFNGLMEQ